MATNQIHQLAPRPLNGQGAQNIPSPPSREESVRLIKAIAILFTVCSASLVVMMFYPPQHPNSSPVNEKDVGQPTPIQTDRDHETIATLVLKVFGPIGATFATIMAVYRHKFSSKAKLKAQLDLPSGRQAIDQTLLTSQQKVHED